MVNPFLSSTNYDTETAIMLERAYITDIGRAVAYTDGDRIFLNTQDNLFKILPAYDDNMLKWLLWHERMHLELKHHNRFFRYLAELSEEDTKDKFQVTKDEVNIIMDILVHDWMSKKFPELVETAVNNLAQFRDRNSLSYTFKTNTLEEMLDEYKKFKHEEDKKEDGGDGEEKDSEEKKESEDSKSKDEDKGKTKDEPKEGKDKKKEDKKKGGTEKTHAEGEHDSTPREKASEDTSEVKTEPESEQPEPEAPRHHDETDWSKLEDIDSKEFITKTEGNEWIEEINRLKNAKLKLAKITKTLNGLVTDTKVRSYKTPSYMQTGQHTIFKGSKKGRASLYLCFDASGSMGRDMQTFKEIIGKAIPQALKTPTVWFSGYAYRDEGREVMKRCEDPEREDYYKGTFADFMNISADRGYSDDGDRTIEMCFKAEQQGYSPIGITDGGGKISWSTSMLKQLKRTVLVGCSRYWLTEAQKINPNIQIIYTGRGY